jgi:hypothetical protein
MLLLIVLVFAAMFVGLLLTFGDRVTSVARPVTEVRADGSQEPALPQPNWAGRRAP